ncbi:hypothetical protein LEP1GSC104_3883 [Leptospira interrogans str. UI 12621]|uniref:Uncharacterized protein n=1 Tax=Leptospira interrogans str. UI 12621 TaxID=1049937 RepID=A0A0F6HGM0_LEPIR|nr:hypothetical protein LEP1GSC104_3883 [Leptospira interrogans str. UI 12621]
MTVGDWIQSKEGCGKNLMNGNCNQYIENKYESVTIGSDGTITANRKIYNGTTSQCGADLHNQVRTVITKTIEWLRSRLRIRKRFCWEGVRPG